MPNWKKVVTSGSNAPFHHVTASGNISASGILYGSSAAIVNTLYLGGENRIDYNNDDVRLLDTGLYVAGGHITASSNISASGTITVSGDIEGSNGGRVALDGNGGENWIQSIGQQLDIRQNNLQKISITDNVIKLLDDTEISTHDGASKLYVNRYNSTYPYAHIQAGYADNDVKVGITLDTRKADGVAENALKIEGDTRLATFQRDLTLGHDAAILGFGYNTDVTLTHVHNAGLRLNSAMKLQFRDTAIHISSPADGDLAIAADDEIDITSTLIDINGNVDISGTLVLEANSTVGWHGSVSRVKILPRDFQPDSGGRPAMTFLLSGEEGDDAWIASNGSGTLFASVPIPTGFKATHVKIHGSDTGQTFTVYEANIANKTTSTKGTATAIETEKAITNVDSTTTNFILIEVSSDGGTDEIHGGYMTIAPI